MLLAALLDVFDPQPCSGTVSCMALLRTPREAPPHISAPYYDPLIWQETNISVIPQVWFLQLQYLPEMLAFTCLLIKRAGDHGKGSEPRHLFTASEMSAIFGNGFSTKLMNWMFSVIWVGVTGHAWSGMEMLVDQRG